MGQLMLGLIGEFVEQCMGSLCWGEIQETLVRLLSWSDQAACRLFMTGIARKQAGKIATAHGGDLMHMRIIRQRT